MATKKPYIIALEEHYQDAEVRRHTGGPGMSTIEERLDDLGALRLREMDEAGIDFQVLSHSIPGLQGVDAATGVPLARRANDRLAETVRAHPDRFAAFASLPTADPRAAADELERTVTKLGFKGAMINGLTDHVFHDDERLLLRSGADLLHDGDGHRPHSVLGRLPVCRQPAGNEMDGNRADLRRGQGKTAERQRQTAVKAVGVRGPRDYRYNYMSS